MKHLLLLYDGHCLLCNRLIRKLLKWDKKDMLRVASLQDYNKLVDPVIPIRADVDSVVLIKNGNVRYKSSAVLDAMIELSSFPLIYRIWYIIPRFLRDGVYDFVARNRYQWFGHSETCILPKPEEKKKYILGEQALKGFID